jgi:hypothetical protein
MKAAIQLATELVYQKTVIGWWLWQDILI